MQKKPFALVLIAVGLIITPSAALADVIIPHVQSTNKQGTTAINKNINRQVSGNINLQNTSQKIRTSRALRRASCLSSYKSQKQSSTRITMRSTAYGNNSTSQQTSTTTSSQYQIPKNGAVSC